jgi:RNA polymerase primary sigma factor/RNA polymerase sigma factor
MPNRRNVMRANDSGSLVHLFGGERAGVDQGIPYPRHADAGMGSDCGAAGEPAPGIDSTPAPGDEVLSIEDLARRFNVSTKTISRWRSHGLVAQRYVVDGRRRVGFLASTVDRFMHDNPLRIERGAKFSQLSGDEHDKIMGWAKRLAVAGAFPAADGRLRPESCARIYQHHLRGEAVDSIARRYNRSKASIYRVILTQRAEHIQQLPLDFMPNALFARKSAEKVVNQPFPGLTDAKRVRRPTGLPAYLASLYEVPLLTREQEVWLFRKFNYLKFKATKLREQLDAENPSGRMMDQIERLYDEIVEIKNRIVRSNLRLVVSIAKRRVSAGDSFFDLVSDGNMSLIRAVEKFDYARGNKFSTYASWAIMKNYARTIPDEHKRRERFRAADMELLHEAADKRADEYQQRIAASDRLQQVGKFLDRLDQREQTIIIRRYGLDHEHAPQTLKEVGCALGVTKERVRQIEAKAIEKLREAAAAEAMLPELE